MSTDSPIFASIGSFIIDDIVYPDGRKVCNVLGGAGIFAIYGMRLWQADELSRNVGYVIHKGFDYPRDIDNQISQLNISLVTKLHPDQHTTRGLNTFGENDHRDFEYVHPIIRATPDDFPDAWIESIKILHIISSPERAIEIVSDWRKREKNSQQKTYFLWEPLPWACLPENLDLIYEAAQMVDIITPNHEELAAMLGYQFNDLLKQYNDDFIKTVEFLADKFSERKLTNDKLVLVVRSSKYGALVLQQTVDYVRSWIPAYWDYTNPDDQDHVVDVTGAGNTFCGGYAYGWIETNSDPIESAFYAAVSASYTVEQVGVPVLYRDGYWNDGPQPNKRLEILKERNRNKREREENRHE
ncbi:MAG: Ribokinase-like protein [Benjaminiella poitrasii]|nr:MAG: Ribokinase-like protein [Benjaminiella poitrasii]